MSIVRVRSKYQVVIPERVRQEIGVEVGDIFEATAKKGAIVLTPKPADVDRDEDTPTERRRIDAQLAQSLADDKQGRSYGPSETHKEMTRFLREQSKALPPTGEAPKYRAR